MAQLKTSVILDLVDRMSRPLARTRAALKSVQETAAKVEGFRKLKQESVATAGKLREAQERAARLAREMAGAAKPSRRLRASFEKARLEAGRYKRALGEQQARLEALRRELRGAGIDTRNLAEHQQRLARESERLSGRLKRLERLKAMTGRMSGAAGKMVGRFGAALRAAGLVAGGAAAMVGGAGAAFGRLFVGTAAKFERYRTILETVEGSSEKARKSFDWVSEFAARTPFEIDEVMGSFVKLRAYGLEPTGGLLRTLGDTAAAMGKPIEQAVEAIADAVTGENERLKEFGIKARTVGKQIVYEYSVNGKTMKKTADSSNRAMIQSTLESIWNEKYAGAMAKQSKTWSGMMSNLADHWTRFVNLVMESGAFDAMKAKLATILDAVDRMAKSGELKRMAVQISDAVVRAVEVIWSLGKATVSVFRAIGKVIDVVWTPIKGLFDMVSGIADKAMSFFDSAFGTRVKESIGRGVAALMAGLGSTEAQQALNRDADRFGPRRDLAGPVATTQVGGMIRVQIDSEGRPRVREVASASRAVGIEVETGMAMAGP